MFNIFNSRLVPMTKFALAATFIVSLSACSQARKKVDEGEARVIPQSEFGPGESWRDEYEPPEQYAATKESFRSRVKKSGIKSRKSSVASRR